LNGFVCLFFFFFFGLVGLFLFAFGSMFCNHLFVACVL
jgi:hypothetical protein